MGPVPGRRVQAAVLLRHWPTPSFLALNFLGGPLCSGLLRRRRTGSPKIFLFGSSELGPAGRHVPGGLGVVTAKGGLSRDLSARSRNYIKSDGKGSGDRSVCADRYPPSGKWLNTREVAPCWAQAPLPGTACGAGVGAGVGAGWVRSVSVFGTNACLVKVSYCCGCFFPTSRPRKRHHYHPICTVMSTP